MLSISLSFHIFYSLTPFPFSIFINNLENELIGGFCEPIYINDIVSFLLMYADDSVLLSETVEGLQNMFDVLYSYSTEWNIDVDIEQLKVLCSEIEAN